MTTHLYKVYSYIECDEDEIDKITDQANNAHFIFDYEEIE